MRVAHGGVVVIAGPDGSGKSTLSSALPGAAFARAPVLHAHHRFGVLPQRENSEVDITRPQEQRPYPLVLCWAKCLYLFVDYQLGWRIRVHPFVRRGGWVVLERGWWDIAIDQRRYRLRSSGWLLRALGRFLPRPDLVIVLSGAPEILRSRKAELSSEEVRRQSEGWQTVLPPRVPRLFIDAALPLTAVIEMATEGVRRISRGRGATRVAR